MIAAFFALPTMASAQAVDDPKIAAILARHDALTRVAVHRCSKPADSHEIIVCGRRAADRYRLPLIVAYEAGDPKGESFWGERQRIQHQMTPLQEHGPFLLGGGSVGIGVTVSSSGQTKYRTPAD
jgi:hypothetical protein